MHSQWLFIPFVSIKYIHLSISLSLFLTQMWHLTLQYHKTLRHIQELASALTKAIATGRFMHSALLIVCTGAEYFSCLQFSPCTRSYSKGMRFTKRTCWLLYSWKLIRLMKGAFSKWLHLNYVRCRRVMKTKDHSNPSYVWFKVF